MIRVTDKVSSILARDEKLIDVFVAASPAFERLRSAKMRKVMARLVTVEQAAKIAGIDAHQLVEHLNAACDGLEAPPAPLEQATRERPVREEVPAWLAALPPAKLVEVDVREKLRAGEEPIREILDAAKALPKGSVMRVRAIFEPAPLYAVLGRQGLGHFTEYLEDEDWRVWFFHDEQATTASPAEKAELPDDGDLIVIDVRGLEPPEPMVRTLEALEALPAGKTLVQLNQRVPQFLLPKLEERGFRYEIRKQSEELVRIFIHRN